MQCMYLHFIKGKPMEFIIENLFQIYALGYCIWFLLMSIEVSDKMNVTPSVNMQASALVALVWPIHSVLRILQKLIGK
jgi:hypothetical protein